MGWSGLKNGDLIAAAEAGGFEILVTADRSIRYQQNLTTRRIALIVLSTNIWPLIRENHGPIIAAIEAFTVGGFVSVKLPRPSRLRRLYNPSLEC